MSMWRFGPHHNEAPVELRRVSSIRNGSSASLALRSLFVHTWRHLPGMGLGRLFQIKARKVELAANKKQLYVLRFSPQQRYDEFTGPPK